MTQIPRIRRETLARGAGVGAVAYVLGYFLTWIFAGRKASELTLYGPFGGSIPDWKALIWVFYDSHFVGTRTPEVTGPGGSILGGGEIIDTVGLLEIEFLFAVPVALLLVGGAIAAVRADASNLRDGMKPGIALVGGYLPLVVIGLFVATHEGMAPVPLRAIILAGLVYPIIFGTLGGAIGGYYRQMTNESDAGMQPK